MFLKKVLKSVQWKVGNVKHVQSKNLQNLKIVKSRLYCESLEIYKSMKSAKSEKLKNI